MAQLCRALLVKVGAQPAATSAQAPGFGLVSLRLATTLDWRLCLREVGAAPHRRIGGAAARMARATEEHHQDRREGQSEKVVTHRREDTIGPPLTLCRKTEDFTEDAGGCEAPPSDGVVMAAEPGETSSTVALQHSAARPTATSVLYPYNAERS